MKMEHPQSSLLSLTGNVGNLLLSYVSSGEGGLKSILNLRQACSTTKKWIDDLPLEEGKQLFSKAHAKVDLSLASKNEVMSEFEILRNFLNSPTPTNVNSLTLLGMRTFTAKKFSPQEENLWRRFVVFWWPKLESLEVDYYDNFFYADVVESLVSQLLSTPSVRRLHCQQIEQPFPPSTPKDFFKLPGKLRCIEELSIDHFRLTSALKSVFFKSLAANRKLKAFDLKSIVRCDLDEISEFIRLTKDNVGLKVTLTMHPSLYVKEKFASAVAASSSSIRINQFNGPTRQGIKSNLKDYEWQNFLKSLEWISNFHVTTADELLKFPNLKRIDSFSISSEVKEKKISFPVSLVRLGVSDLIPQCLPQTLTHLDIKEFRSTVHELLDSLASLDRRCPLLNTLLLKWTCSDSSVEMFCDYSQLNTSACNPHSQEEAPFKNLKSLTFIVCSPDFKHASVRKIKKAKMYQNESDGDENQNERVISNLNGVRWILLNGLKVPQLPLLHLKLDFCPRFECDDDPPPVLDRPSLNHFIKGATVASSLLRVEVGRNFVHKDALPLVEVLKSLAAENVEKRLKTVGSIWHGLSSPEAWESVEESNKFSEMWM